jgi:antitoxin PrlF
MAVATLTSKGRITLPQAVRTALGLQCGAKVDFIAQDGGFKLIPLRTDVSVLKGRFAGRAAKPVSIKAMSNAAGEPVTTRQRKAS